MVLVVKGHRGVAETAGGAPLSGRDGAALKSAFERLGWGAADEDVQYWCGVLLTPLKAEPLADARLRLLIESIDPTVIVTLDEHARLALVGVLLEEKSFVRRLPQPPTKGGASASSPSQTAQWLPKTTTDAGGRLLVSVDGFEAALDSDTSKQRVWQQLKQAAYSEALKRFK